MKISLVVPAYNEEKLLPATLQALQRAAEAFRKRKWDWEVIVCDNNSTDRTAEIARRAGAQVVFEPQNQIARARNAGASVATGEWLVFVDADSIPSCELFEDVAAAMESGGVLAGGVTVKMDTYSPGMRFAGAVWNLISRVRKWCAGSFIFCETPAFRDCGGFSHDLFVSEELDLSDRLKAIARKRGKRMVILSRHPLLTSARKLHLYGHWEHLRFLARVMRGGRRVMQTREECGIWYDGRR